MTLGLVFGWKQYCIMVKVNVTNKETNKQTKTTCPPTLLILGHINGWPLSEDVVTCSNFFKVWTIIKGEETCLKFFIVLVVLDTYWRWSHNRRELEGYEITSHISGVSPGNQENVSVSFCCNVTYTTLSLHCLPCFSIFYNIKQSLYIFQGFFWLFLEHILYPWDWFQPSFVKNWEKYAWM